MPEISAEDGTTLFAEHERKPNGHGTTAVTIMSDNEFLATFRPLDYLVAGILQRGFIYALTGATGHAKSAIALLLAELVASSDRNAMFGKHRVEKGNVLYLVGENPIELCMRVIGANSLHEPQPYRRYWISGRVDIEASFDGIRANVIATMGSIDLVVVDTSAAYFLGDEEMSNTQMGSHARKLRRLTTLPGDPCVLVLCHPIKHAQEPAQLLPRGGGAFLAELDGNLTAWKRDEVLIDLHYTKMRGPGFEPMTLRLESISTPKLVDTKGNMLGTVRAVVVGNSEEDRQSGRMRADEDQVLVTILFRSDQSMAEIAIALKWVNGAGEPLKARVQRAISRLEKQTPKLIKKNRDRWELTDKGKEVATHAARNMPTETEQENLF